MCDVSYYLIIGILENVETAKTRIVKYISHKVNRIISADDADIGFQY